MNFPITAQVGVRKAVPGPADPYSGEASTVWDDPVPVGVFGYGPATEGDVEPEEIGRSEVVVGVNVYGPSDLADKVGPLDRVEVPAGGPLYEVVGYPGDYSHGPFGFVAGCVLALRRIEG